MIWEAVTCSRAVLENMSQHCFILLLETCDVSKEASWHTHFRLWYGLIKTSCQALSLMWEFPIWVRQQALCMSNKAQEGRTVGTDGTYRGSYSFFRLKRTQHQGFLWIKFRTSNKRGSKWMIPWVWARPIKLMLNKRLSWQHSVIHAQCMSRSPRQWFIVMAILARTLYLYVWNSTVMLFIT